MRFIYNKNIQYVSFKIKEQIKQLNSLVIMEILPNIFTQVEQNINYLKNLNKPFVPIELPINTNNKNRPLQSFSSIFQ